MQEVRSEVPKKGLNAEISPLYAGAISKEIYRIAAEGLARRAKLMGIENESRFLEPVREITETGVTQAQKLLQQYQGNFREDLPGLVYNWQKEQMENCLKE
jgi:glutamate--cysteine ligase